MNIIRIISHLSHNTLNGIHLCVALAVTSELLVTYFLNSFSHCLKIPFVILDNTINATPGGNFKTYICHFTYIELNLQCKSLHATGLF